MTWSIQPHLRRQIYDHAKAVFPNECCGLVVMQEGEEHYRACENISPTPDCAFMIPPSIYNHYKAEGTLVAVIHSHPNGPAAPTASDMRHQARSEVPWGIVVFAQGKIVEDFVFPVALDEPLKGLPFREGVRDCFTVVRKWWFQNMGVTMEDFPRSPGWWVNEDGSAGENLYMDNFEKWGFRQLTPKEIHADPNNLKSPLLLPVGAIGLGRVRSIHRINHAVVYTGGQQMTHHLFGKASGEEPISRWLPKIEHWLWRDADDQCPPLRETGEPIRRLPPARHRVRSGVSAGVLSDPRGVQGSL